MSSKGKFDCAFGIIHDYVKGAVMALKAVLKFLSLTWAVLLLVACGGGGGGGGGGSEPPQPEPVVNEDAEGLWVGQTDTDRYISGLVLDDGEIYILYSVQDDPSVIAGFIHGDSTVTGDQFSSNNLKDYNFEGLGVTSGSASATISEKDSLEGKVTSSSGGSVSFSSTYDSAYELTPFVGDVAGDFSGWVAVVGGVELANLSIDGSGNISAIAEGGCSATGVIYERGSGNAYDVSLTFGASPCSMANETLTGIAYFDGQYDVIYIAAPNNSRTNAGLFVGAK